MNIKNTFQTSALQYQMSGKHALLFKQDNIVVHVSMRIMHAKDDRWLKFPVQNFKKCRRDKLPDIFSCIPMTI